MKPLFVVSVLALLTGCVTIRSNKLADAVPEFGRILVVSKLDNVPADYPARYVGAFPPRYEVCALTTNRLTFGNPDSLIRQKARQCNSDVILSLELNRTNVTTYGRYTSISPSDYYAEMRTAVDNKPFWKAVISSPYKKEGPNAIFISPRVIVSRLQQDGILDQPASASRTIP